MNRKKLFIINIIASLFLQFVTLICGFLLPKIMLSHFGSDVNGLVTSINQFVNYCSLIELGLTGSAIAQLYRPLADGNKEDINKVISTTRFYYIKIGFIFSFFIVVLAIIYPIFIKSNLLSYVEVLFLVLIMGGAGCMEFFCMSKYRVLLTADQKSYVINIATVVSVVLNVVLIYILCLLGLNIVLIRFIAIFSVFSRLMILLIYCKKKYKDLNYNYRIDKTILSSRGDVLLSQISDSLQKGAPIIVITFIMSLTDVSVFSVYYIVVSGIMAILYGISSPSFSMFGNMLAKNELKTLKTVYNVFETAYLLIASFVYIVTAYQINSFIYLYTLGISDVSYDLGYAGICFALYGLSYNMRIPLYTLVMANNNYRSMRFANIVQCGIMLVIGSISCYFFGVVGLLLVGIIGNIFYFASLIFIMRKQINVLSAKNMIKKMVCVLLSILVCALWFDLYKTTSESYFAWIISSCLISAMVGFTCLIIFGLFNRTDFKGLILFIKNKKINN